MSTKRIFSITIFGLLLIAAAIVVMLLTLNIRRESQAVALPETPIIVDRPDGTAADPLLRIEINAETIQSVIATLSRPESYSRDVTVESFWDGGQATFQINVNVDSHRTALRITPPVGPERRVIITPNRLYIWNEGDYEPFIGTPTSLEAIAHSDQWQMLPTFEDIMGLDKKDILDAGYIDIDGALSVFVVYHSPLLGNLRRYYISIEQGLIIAVSEHDETGTLVYSMTATDAIIGDVDEDAFLLPDRLEVTN